MCVRAGYGAGNEKHKEKTGFKASVYSSLSCTFILLFMCSSGFCCGGKVLAALNPYRKRPDLGMEGPGLVFQLPVRHTLFTSSVCVISFCLAYVTCASISWRILMLTPGEWALCFFLVSPTIDYTCSRHIIPFF